VRCEQESCADVWEAHRIDATYDIYYSDLCVVVKKGQCQIRSPLEFWHNYSDFVNRVGNNQTKLLEQLSSDTFADGSLVYRERIFGSTEASLVVNETSGLIQSARAILITYYTSKTWSTTISIMWCDQYFKVRKRNMFVKYFFPTTEHTSVSYIYIYIYIYYVPQ
jgi:hypothetical protein